MNSKEIAELATQIVVAVIGSGKYDCTDSEKVCELYSAVILQVQKSEAEINELKKSIQEDIGYIR